MNPQFHIPLSFSSDESEYDYDYDYSSEEEDDSIIEIPNIPLNEKKFAPAPIHPPPPHRDVRSNILRPIPKINPPSNGIPRPQTSESVINTQTNTESTSPIEKSTIEQDTEFVDEHFYTIEMKRFKSLFESSQKRFLMAEENQLIYDLTIKSKEKKIKLPYKHHLEVSKGHTEFSLKSDEQFQKELMRINFMPPREHDECRRRTIVTFVNMKNKALPRKLDSLGTHDDDNFKGHYHIKSERNTALVVQGNKIPVLTILELEKNRIEIRTILNIDKEIVFAMAIASFLGKDLSGRKGLIQGIRGVSLAPSFIVTNDKVVE